MKKIILCILLISVLFLLAGCNNNKLNDISDVSVEKIGMIIMPDGHIIEGMCTNFLRYSNGWAYIKIDGINYYANDWRIVTWEK